MADEDPAEYDRQLQELEHTLFPKNAIEFELVRQVADAQWRLRRVTRLEAGLLTHTYDLNKRLTLDGYAQRNQDRATRNLKLAARDAGRTGAGARPYNSIGRLPPVRRAA